jgi:hypothetical protein
MSQMSELEPKDQPLPNLDAEKELRKRNRVLALALMSFVVLVFLVSLVKLSGN